MNIEQHKDDHDMTLHTTAVMTMREIVILKMRVEDRLADMLTRGLAPTVEAYLKANLDWNRIRKAAEDAMIRKMERL